MIFVHSTPAEDAGAIIALLDERFNVRTLRDWRPIRADLAPECRCVVAAVLRTDPGAIHDAGNAQASWPLIPFVLIVSADSANIAALARIRVTTTLTVDELSRLPDAVSAACGTSLLESFAAQVEAMFGAPEPLLRGLVDACRSGHPIRSVEKGLGCISGLRRTTLWRRYCTVFGPDAPHPKELVALLDAVRAVELRLVGDSWDAAARTLGISPETNRAWIRYFTGANPGERRPAEIRRLLAARLGCLLRCLHNQRSRITTGGPR